MTNFIPRFQGDTILKISASKKGSTNSCALMIDALGKQPAQFKVALGISNSPSQIFWNLLKISCKWKTSVRKPCYMDLLIASCRLLVLLAKHVFLSNQNRDGFNWCFCSHKTRWMLLLKEWLTIRRPNTSNREGSHSVQKTSHIQTTALLTLFFAKESLRWNFWRLIAGWWKMSFLLQHWILLSFCYICLFLKNTLP